MYARYTVVTTQEEAINLLAGLGCSKTQEILSDYLDMNLATGMSYGGSRTNKKNTLLGPHNLPRITSRGKMLRVSLDSLLTELKFVSL